MAETRMDTADGIYRGRIMSDGQGNMLADESRRVGDRQVQAMDENGNPLMFGGEPLIVSTPIFQYGENHGRPIAYHEGSFIFLNPGDESHNDRHHQQFAEFRGTTAEDAEDQPHHNGVLEDDPHYDADTENHTRLRYSPDKIAATETGHTDAYMGRSEPNDS